jgi:hypothetical protein
MTIFAIPPAHALLTPTTTTAGAIFGGDYYSNPNPTLMCSNGYVLTATWSNATLTGGGEDYSLAFAITCTRLNDDRTLSAVTELKTGLSTSPPNVSSACTSGKAATAIRVKWNISTNNNRWVASTGTNCNNSVDYSAPEINALAHATNPVGTVTTSTSSCQAGSYVIGIEFEYGAGLHSVGALCGSFIETVAPTITSSTSFTAAENQTSVGTATANEIVTWSKVGGVDSATVVINSSTGVITFSLAPNFEAPTDVGANNVYDITIRATDAAGNATNLAITITVTDVVDTSAFNSFALAGGVSTATFRTTIQISANLSVASKVTFSVDNVRIPGCIKVSTSGSAPNIIATCSWKPARRGPVTLSSISIPINVSISGATSTPLKVLVANRTGKRGI